MNKLVAVILALSAAPAWADGQRALGRAGISNVFVWKDSASHSEALRLISAGVYSSNPVLVMRLLSCIADPGDHAVVIDGGIASSTILVVDGDNSGCRGVVANEDLR